MPDFAPNVTARYKLHYTAAGRPHTIMCRAARGTLASPGAGQCAVYLRGLFSALAPLLADDLSFTSAEFALTDSDLFFPAAVPAAVVGGSPIAGFSKQDTITHLTFSGRGTGGSKVNVKVYGVNWAPDTLPGSVESDFVVLGTELAQIANAVISLNTGSGIIVAIDNTAALYANRATIKVNDFWLRQVRKGL